MQSVTNSVDALFAGKDAAVRAAYDRLLDALRPLGPFREEPKRTSIHLCHRVGFAGVHPRRRSLSLNLRTDYAIQSGRVAQSDQVSKGRYHNEVMLSSPEEVDAELVGWLKDAYALG
jgi:Domain of unknown function (DUF5655)